MQTNGSPVRPARAVSLRRQSSSLHTVSNLVQFEFEDVATWLCLRKLVDIVSLQ